MGRYQRVARGLEAHLLAATPSPPQRADQTKRVGVKGLLKNHPAVALEGDALLRGHVIGVVGKDLSWPRLTASTRCGGASFVVPRLRCPPVVKYPCRASTFDWA